MDGPGQKVAQAIVHQTLTLHARQIFEDRTGYDDPEMRFAFGSGAGMAGVAMAFVDDFQPGGLKAGLKKVAHAVGDLHGKAPLTSVASGGAGQENRLAGTGR